MYPCRAYHTLRFPAGYAVESPPRPSSPLGRFTRRFSIFDDFLQRQSDESPFVPRRRARARRMNAPTAPDPRVISALRIPAVDDRRSRARLARVNPLAPALPGLSVLFSSFTVSRQSRNNAGHTHFIASAGRASAHLAFPRANFLLVILSSVFNARYPYRGRQGRAYPPARSRISFRRGPRSSSSKERTRAVLRVIVAGETTEGCSQAVRGDRMLDEGRGVAEGEGREAGENERETRIDRDRRAARHTLSPRVIEASRLHQHRRARARRGVLIAHQR